jgi:hypothetical protein
MGAQRDVDPVRPVEWPRRLSARTALQEQQIRQVVVLLAGIDQLTREYLDHAPTRLSVIERNGNDMLARHVARQPDHGTDPAAPH